MPGADELRRQKPRHLRQIVRRGALFQPRHGGRQLARIVRLGAAQVKQQVAVPRLEPGQELAGRGDQLARLARRGPARLAVVEHHRQHRRQIARLRDSSAQQFALQHRRVLDHPQRHRRVAARLEFEEHQHVRPAALGVCRAYAPHRVAAALAEVVADVFGGDLFQGAQVDRFEHLGGQDAAQQVGHHLREGVEALVDGVAGGGVLLHAATVAARGRRTCTRSPSRPVGNQPFVMPDIAHACRRTFAGNFASAAANVNGLRTYATESITSGDVVIRFQGIGARCPPFRDFTDDRSHRTPRRRW